VVSILEIKILLEMTPKEKAEDLYNRMLPKSGVVFKSQAKQCALVAIDEILNVTVGLTDFTDDFDYWQEVKQEIEKL
jgi:hypothetical protein